MKPVSLLVVLAASASALAGCGGGTSHADVSPPEKYAGVTHAQAVRVAQFLLKSEDVHDYARGNKVDLLEVLKRKDSMGVPSWLAVASDEDGKSVCVAFHKDPASESDFITEFSGCNNDSSLSVSVEASASVQIGP